MGVLTFTKPGCWHTPNQATTVTVRYGTAETLARDRIHPRLGEAAGEGVAETAWPAGVWGRCHLKQRWRTLRHVTLSPSRIGDVARAALVLNEH
ncbi:hypothetical protein ABZ904_46185 [Streptomyces sp. NPDC046900]|uniref:hypothetical protein n=1 Tax=Streptomyces sp. NPDC046900 TaxID=3155473 RepID=UPI0033C08F9E